MGETERIVAMDGDPGLRNLLVTQGYHDLAEGFCRLFGYENRNWCSFAIWASRTAGRFIRSDEVPAAFREFLEKSRPARHALQRIDEVALASNSNGNGTFGLLDPIGEALADVQWHIMTGNKVVFAEVGVAFARFIDAFEGASEPQPRALDAILDNYSTGDALPDLITEGPGGTLMHEQRGGQGWLRSALETYHEALFETEERCRAQLMLLANAYVGLHEQTRLQSYIKGALTAPVHEVLDLKHDQAVQRMGARVGVRDRIVRMLRPLILEIENLWEEFSTVAMMTLRLPDRELRLGSDLPAPPGQPLYPETLSRIELEDLRQVLGRFHAAKPEYSELGPIDRIEEEAFRVLRRFGIRPREANGSGAGDWTELDERMRFILPLFRSRQTDRNLERQPFTLSQRRALLGGEMPSGSLS